jgi:hypothetical protein
MNKIGSNFRAVFFFLYLYTSTHPVSVRANTELVTFDLCSNREIEIFSKNKIGLNITLHDLVPRHPVWIEVSLSPANHALNPSDKHVSKKFTEKIKISDNTSLSIKRKIKLLNIEKHRFEIGLSQTWNIQLMWIQPTAPHSGGSAFKTLQFVEKKVKRLYAVTDSMLCAWETPPDLDSQLYFNPDQDVLRVSRETSVRPGVSTFLGLDGVTQDHYQLQFPYLITPPEGVPSRFLGSFYLANQKISFTETVKKMTQKWNLSSGESGVFGKRLTFQRFPAIEYQKTSTQSCSHWEIATQGLLDIGAASNEFVVFPKAATRNFQSNPDRIVKFLESQRPRLNTCDSSLSEAHIQAHSQVGTEGLVYFYPEDRDT